MSPRVGHPAPPLSWMGSNEAVLASRTISGSAKHVKEVKRKRSQSDPPTPHIHNASMSRQQAELCQKQCSAAAS